MKNIETSGGVLHRLKKIMPPGIRPKFSSAQEWKSWQAQEGRRYACEVMRLNEQTRAERLLGRSGIQELHRQCSFDNYVVTCEGQRHALNMARRYAHNFGKGFGGFVFSGKPGTGKNHLAAAICNHLLQTKRTALVVTIPDLSAKIRSTYEAGGGAELAMLEDICGVNLLVLDDIGVQRLTKNEWVLINQIIDRRLSALRPVGILTNLNHQQASEVLGDRIMDRLKMDNGIWINFNWESFRSKVKRSHLIN